MAEATPFRNFLGKSKIHFAPYQIHSFAKTRFPTAASPSAGATAQTENFLASVAMRAFPSL
jgi:hypothetical protein